MTDTPRFPDREMILRIAERAIRLITGSGFMSTGMHLTRGRAIFSYASYPSGNECNTIQSKQYTLQSRLPGCGRLTGMRDKNDSWRPTGSTRFTRQESDGGSCDGPPSRPSMRIRTSTLRGHRRHCGRRRSVSPRALIESVGVEASQRGTCSMPCEHAVAVSFVSRWRCTTSWRNTTLIKTTCCRGLGEGKK
jgi:hypothetical protein